MIEATSFQDIVNNVNDNLKKASVRMTFYDAVDPVSSNAMAEINKKVKQHGFIGVMFCNPNSTFCKSEIISHLNYFHYRSAKHIIFFVVVMVPIGLTVITKISNLLLQLMEQIGFIVIKLLSLCCVNLSNTPSGAIVVKTSYCCLM